MKWCNVNFHKVEDTCNGLASGVARSSIPRLPLRSPLVFHLNSRDLFLASFSEGHSSYRSKMIAGSLSLLFSKERGSIFIDNANKNPV